MQVILTYYHQKKSYSSFLHNLLSAKNCPKTCVGN